jgi:hypothetical protein
VTALVPARTVLLVSGSAPGALAARLRSCVGDGAEAAFRGSVDDDGFVITRFNDFRGTAMPLVRGRIRPAAGGSAVELRLRPPRVVVLFMAIWLGFLAAVAAMIVVARAAGGGRSLLALLVPGGLATFSWYLMTAVFAADARWAVAALLNAVPALRPAPVPEGVGPR